MRRLLLIATALVTFLAGVTVSRLFSPTRYVHYQVRSCGREYKRLQFGDYKRRHVSEFKPLQVFLDSESEPANKQIPYAHRFAIVTNVSTIPIRYYVLGFGTDRSTLAPAHSLPTTGLPTPILICRSDHSCQRRHGRYRSERTLSLVKKRLFGSTISSFKMASHGAPTDRVRCRLKGSARVVLPTLEWNS